MVCYLKLNSRFIILTIFLVFGSLGFIPTQAATNQGSNIRLTAATTSVNVYSTYTQDNDYDGFEDTVDMSIELYHAGFNGNLTTLYIDVYDGSSIFLKRVYVESYTYFGSGYQYFYPQYRSDYRGTLMFIATVQIDGVDVASQSFTLYDMHEYMIPELAFTYVNWNLLDNDGDALNDRLKLELGVSTANITNWPGSTLYVYLENPTDGSWIYVRDMYRYVEMDEPNVYGNTTYEHFIREAGNYRFDLEVYYNEISLSQTYYWNGASVDSLPPFTISTTVSTFTSDTFDVFVDITFRDFSGGVDVYMDVYHDGAGYIGYWYTSVQPTGSAVDQVMFHGAFPYSGNYTFIFNYYANGDYFGREEMQRDFQTAFLGSNVIFSNNPTFGDQDEDGALDYINFNSQLQYVNLFGEHYVDMTVYIHDGDNYVEIDYQNYTSFNLGGSGTVGFNYGYNPGYSGNYLFVFNVFYDGTSTTLEYYWFNADTAWGDEGINIETYAYFQDLNGDYNDDNLRVDNYIYYDTFIAMELFAELTVFVYDEATDTYQFVTSMSESHFLFGNGNIEVIFEFFAEFEGDYEFHFDFYINGELSDYSFVDWNYLWSPQSEHLELDAWSDTWDEDNDGWEDHINLIVSLSYSLYPGVDIEVYVDVFLNDELVNDFYQWEYLEGNQYREFHFDYVAEQDGNYQFKIRIVRNAEQINELVYYWDDAHAYNPDHTPGNTDDTSTTPELPVPAGSMYIFVLALFAAATTIRRRFN